MLHLVNRDTKSDARTTEHNFAPIENQLQSGGRY
jgi:hypothetical protein